VVKIEGMWVILHFPAGNSHHLYNFFLLLLLSRSGCQYTEFAPKPDPGGRI